MELFVADLLVVAGVIVAARLTGAQHARAVPVTVATAASALFVILRNHYKLEESPFLWALSAVSVGAFVATLAVSIVLRQPLRRAAVFGVAAGALVPALLIAYYAALFTSCLVGGCDDYS
jgi:hypothetical protein